MKKLKKTEDTSAAVATPQGKKTPRSKSGTPNTPFRRVKEEDVVIDSRLMSNSFETINNSWGKAAYDKLKFTQGKSFRHEKTKKKRGSYKGGPIDTHVVNSIKFDDSD